MRHEQKSARDRMNKSIFHRHFFTRSGIWNAGRKPKRSRALYGFVNSQARSIAVPWP
jgi:hypothetical protein